MAVSLAGTRVLQEDLGIHEVTEHLVADLVERCRPVFEALGRQTFAAGLLPWQANAVKLCGNFMIASMLETFGEAFTTMRKAGVDCHLFLETMTALFGSPVSANDGRIMADERFEPAGFALTLGLKDVRLVLETAQEYASPMPLASLIRDHLLSAVAHGQADLDCSSISRVIARNAGLP
ncbi:MAG: NAD-binding protein [Acidobacteriia bacterium]|nr:NAD-binding protein [Terriglobia bacterium]